MKNSNTQNPSSFTAWPATLENARKADSIFWESRNALLRYGHDLCVANQCGYINVIKATGRKMKSWEALLVDNPNQ